MRLHGSTTRGCLQRQCANALNANCLLGQDATRVGLAWRRLSHMDIFRVGPDGLLLIQALLVSMVVAVLAWRRIALSTATISTAVVALVFSLVSFAPVIAWTSAGSAR